MTKADVLIVELDVLAKHPNADTLDIATVGGYTLVTKSGNFKQGDKALFIQVDSILPLQFKEFYDLTDIVRTKVKTKKLRGCYSQGLLLPLTHPALKDAQVGQDFGEILGIEKYEPYLKSQINGIPRPWDSRMIHYDIENVQSPRYSDIFKQGEQIYATEKIHGSHTAMGLIDDKFVVTSRRVNLKKPENPKSNIYWEVFTRLNLGSRLQDISETYGGINVILRGEVFGEGIQFLDYGHDSYNRQVAFFDIELGLGNFLPEDQFRKLMKRYDLPTVPLRYTGPYDFNMLLELADKDSILSTKQQISEGLVIKPVEECAVYPYLSRKILKLIGRRYAEKSADQEEKEG